MRKLALSKDQWLCLFDNNFAAGFVEVDQPTYSVQETGPSVTVCARLGGNVVLTRPVAVTVSTQDLTAQGRKFNQSYNYKLGIKSLPHQTVY